MTDQNNYDRNSILKGYNLLLYFAGSMIMYEPTEECFSDFWSNGILRNLPVSSRNPRFMKAASQLRSSCGNSDLCQPVLRDDFNRLFSDKGPLLAPPFKSYYKDKLTDRQTANESVTDFYNTYGWRFRSGYNIVDDHLGVEVIFLTLLSDKLAAFDDGPCIREMKNEIRRFIADHLLSWLPEWNRLVQKNAQSLSYKGIANLIYAACEDIYGFMSPPDTITG